MAAHVMTRAKRGQPPSPKTFDVGASVRVTDGGPFNGELGTFVGIKPNGWTQVSILDRNARGRAAPVQTVVIVRSVEAG